MYLKLIWCLNSERVHLFLLVFLQFATLLRFICVMPEILIYCSQSGEVVVVCYYYETLKSEWFDCVLVAEMQYPPVFLSAVCPQISFGGLPVSVKPTSGGKENFVGCMEGITYNGENITSLVRRKKVDTTSFVRSVFSLCLCAQPWLNVDWNATCTMLLKTLSQFVCYLAVCIFS